MNKKVTFVRIAKILSDAKFVDSIETGKIVINGKTYEYSAKVFEEPSDFGLDKGKISKLTIKKDGKFVVNFDRGWDIRPQEADDKKALAEIRRKLGDSIIKDKKPTDYKALAKELTQRFHTRFIARSESDAIEAPYVYGNRNLDKQIVDYLKSKGYKIMFNSIGDDGYYTFE